LLTQARTRAQAVPVKRRDRAVKPLQMQHGCYHCGYGQFTGIPRYRLSCPSCHKPLNPEQTLRLTREVSA
jgi:hypothetical protein